METTNMQLHAVTSRQAIDPTEDYEVIEKRTMKSSPPRKSLK